MLASLAALQTPLGPPHTAAPSSTASSKSQTRQQQQPVSLLDSSVAHRATTCQQDPGTLSALSCRSQTSQSSSLTDSGGAVCVVVRQ